MRRPMLAAVGGLAVAGLGAAGCGGGPARLARVAPTTAAPGAASPVGGGPVGGGPVGGGPAPGKKCAPVPPAAPALGWLPGDLPLPPGSRALPEAPGSTTPADPRLHEGTVAMPLALDGVVGFLTGQWPPRGWSPGGGDSELGEADRSFRRGRESLSARIRSPYCDAGWSEVTLRYGVGGPACPAGTPSPCDYRFEGFLPPVSARAVNAARAGDPVVLSWRLADPAGRPVTDLTAMVENHFSAPNQGSSSSLRYQGDHFALTVFTAKDWAGTSKTFTLTLSDGTTHTAAFRFG
ncbi:MAG: PxKF domain-containing protein [Actinobacteria bacterium]|nr:PxKF domain-containing protein [Actinomycetota bacterium]